MATDVQMFRIFPYLTGPLVVVFGVDKTQFKVLLYGFEGRICFVVEFLLYIVEKDRLLDLLIVVRIKLLGRPLHERDGQNTVSVEFMRKSATISGRGLKPR